MSEGGSASRRAEELHAEAAAARANADSLEREAGAWQAGADGERRVGAQLKALPSGWRVLNDLLLRPGRSATNLDHVVVGPAGIYLVDTKNWSGRLTIHEGTLWQHNGGHRSHRASMEQAARAAAEIESVLGVPVTPVIALAGSAGADLEPCRLNGVEVVSAGRLRRWLCRQPESTSAAEVDALVRRVAMTFPPAAPADAPPLLAGETARGWGQPPRKSRGSRRPATRRRRQRGALWKLILALTLLAVAPSLLPWVAGSVAERVETSVRPGGPGIGTPDACRIVEKQVVALLGGRAKADLDRSAGQCRWAADVKPREGPTDVTINFGPRSGSMAIASAQAGSAVVLVPKGQSNPEWTTAKLTTPQGFSIRLRYAYPKNATRAQREKADASALSDSIALAEALAEALPRTSDPSG